MAREKSREEAETLLAKTPSNFGLGGVLFYFMGRSYGKARQPRGLIALTGGVLLARVVFEHSDNANSIRLSKFHFISTVVDKRQRS